MNNRHLLLNVSQLLLGVLTLGRHSGSADWTCPPLTGSQGLLLLHEQLCFFRSDFFMTWGDAESYCRKHGGILAKERSRKTNLFFKRQLLANFNKPKTIPCFWIGLNDKGDAGNWRWSDGEEPVYTNWPLFDFMVSWLEEWIVDCGASCTSGVDLDGFQTWVWSKQACGSLHRFLCQFDAVPVLTTLPYSESTAEQVTPKPRRPRQTVTQIIRLANEKGGRLSATPNWTMKALTATMCARQCQNSGSTCQVFNYNHVTKQCHAYSKESVITEGRIMEKGWSLWKLSIIIF